MAARFPSASCASGSRATPLRTHELLLRLSVGSTNRDGAVTRAARYATVLTVARNSLTLMGLGEPSATCSTCPLTTAPSICRGGEEMSETRGGEATVGRQVMQVVGTRTLELTLTVTKSMCERHWW